LAVFVTRVTSGSASTVNPVWPIALHLVLLVDKSGGTEEVGSLLSAAVPVLCTVEKVGVPAVVPPNADIVGMVVGGSTVRVAAAVFALILVTVVVTLVAHLAFATIDAVREVALDFVSVVQQVFAVLIVAHQVGPMAPRAVPVLPAVKVVRIPSVFLVCAVHEMSAIRSGCVTGFAVVVALVTDGSLPAVGQLLEVASIEDQVIDLWRPCCRIIWADYVFPFPLVAVPVFSAVVGVREIPITKLLAVRYSSAVSRCGWCCLWWLCGTHGGVVAGSGATVNIFSVGAPVKHLVENPWKSVGREWFTLLVRNCPLHAVVVERAGLWIRLCEESIGITATSTGHLVGTLAHREGGEEE